jgi:phosphoglycolate phosphatase
LVYGLHPLVHPGCWIAPRSRVGLKWKDELPEPLPTPRAFVFDLDGTLVDSLRDIAESLNRCLEMLGLPARPVDDYRYMVGEGIPRLCERAIGATNPHLVPRLGELARAVYRTRVLQHTRPYPGVPQLVRRARARGIKLGLLSNKPHELTLRVVEAFWPDGCFASVYGYLEDEFRKPSPHYLRRICAALAVEPGDTWVIGDTPTDMATAVAAGAIGVGVTWGFRQRGDLEAAGARLIVDRPEELL